MTPETLGGQQASQRAPSSLSVLRSDHCYGLNPPNSCVEVLPEVCLYLEIRAYKEVLKVK